MTEHEAAELRREAIRILELLYNHYADTGQTERADTVVTALGILDPDR